MSDNLQFVVRITNSDSARHPMSDKLQFVVRITKLD
jgi:hypothetical protein